MCREGESGVKRVDQSVRRASEPVALVAANLIDGLGRPSYGKSLLIVRLGKLRKIAVSLSANRFARPPCIGLILIPPTLIADSKLCVPAILTALHSAAVCARRFDPEFTPMHDTPSMSAPATQVAPLPAPRARTFVLLVIAFTSSTMLTGWFGTEDEESVTGQLHAPIVEVRTPKDRQISKWLVADGSHVAENHEIAALVDPHAANRIKQKQREIESLEIELRQRTAKASIDLAWRNRAIDSEILTNRLKAADLIQKHYDQKIELHAWRDHLNKDKRSVGRSKSPDQVFQPVSHTAGIVSNGRVVSIRQFEAARNSVEVTKVQLQLCEDRLKDLEELKKRLPADVRRATGVDETRAKLLTAKSQLEKLKAHKSAEMIRAPAWGTLRIADSTADKSGPVQAQIVDEEHQYLVVTVPSRLLGRFKIGQTVTVRFNNHVRHSGNVVRIDGPATGSDSVKMIVDPKGRLWPGVPLGTAARVIVPQDE